MQNLQRQTSLGAFPLYPADILLADCVPCAHVLFHACREAVFFAFGEGRAGLGDAALKAVLVEFLRVRQPGCMPGSNQQKRACSSHVWTHLDQHARILHGGLLLHLAHDRRLGVAGAKRIHGRNWAGGRREDARGRIANRAGVVGWWARLQKVGDVKSGAAR